MENQKKLLVLMDGSERARMTLTYLGQVAAFKDFKIVLYHVFSGIPECYRILKKAPSISMS